jgi:enoyl-CoA hydratase/carnithine racemase
MFDLCEGLTPWVQRNSIDEGYLDLAPCGLRDRAAVDAAILACFDSADYREGRTAFMEKRPARWQGR